MGNCKKVGIAIAAHFPHISSPTCAFPTARSAATSLQIRIDEKQNV